MEKVEGGIWEAFVPGLKRYDAYQYAIHKADGSSFVGKADPYGFHAATRPDVSSKIYDLDTGYQWGDRDWFTFRAKNPLYRRPMNIYECHLGSWRRTGEGEFLSYRDITTYLVPYVKEMGFGGHRASPMWSCSLSPSTPWTPPGATSAPATSPPPAASAPLTT